jgi:pyruvate kinase
MRNTKIVCTVGPASSDRSTIRALADAGMSAARLNTSHGTTEERAETIERVRAVDAATDQPLAVIVDLQGPEIRTAPVDEPFQLERGASIRFAEGNHATPEKVGLSHPVHAVEPGDRILLDDGRIETVVEGVEGDAVVARVDIGGEVGSRTGVNVPGVDLDVDLITAADRAEIELAAEMDADFVAASFVRDADDVYAIRDVIESHGAEIPILAKIERAGAVSNLDEILEATFGVMVARGDLGVECPLEDVPLTQKRIISRAQAAGVPVITATEMLDSMIRAPRPTRAEASDVANAVFDGTDAVMLSGETAVGDHPVRVVETMDRIIRQAERSDEYTENQEQRVPRVDDSRTEALARSARYLARDIDAAAVIVASESGYTARKTAMFRPGVPVVATTPDDHVRRQLALSWGVNVQSVKYSTSIEAVLNRSVTAAMEGNIAESGDTVVVLSGMMTALEGTNTTNMLKVHVAAEAIATGRTVVGGRVAGQPAQVSDGDITTIPERTVLFLPADFEGELTGATDRLVGIVDARPGMTGYPAIVARELEIPMLSGAPLPAAIPDGTTVTLDAERGIVYEGDVLRKADSRTLDEEDN